MAHKIPELVAWLSRFVQLHPGDVIATGTYHVGLGPMNNGDTLEIDIEKLGKARFTVKAARPAQGCRSGCRASRSRPPGAGCRGSKGTRLSAGAYLSGKDSANSFILDGSMDFAGAFHPALSV